MAWLSAALVAAVAAAAAAAVCPWGHYTSDDGCCTKCPPGRFADAEGERTECQECLEGQYAEDFGFVACKNCPKGHTSPLAAASCVACPAGQYSYPSTGVFECTRCAQGQFSSAPGREECAFCAEGTFADSEGQSACHACDPGTYTTDTLGATECVRSLSAAFTLLGRPVARQAAALPPIARRSTAGAALAAAAAALALVPLALLGCRARGIQAVETGAAQPDEACGADGAVE